MVRIRKGEEDSMDYVTSCPSCGADRVAGTQWCALCRRNINNPALGRLATPGKRLGAWVLDSVIPLVVVWLMVVPFVIDLAIRGGEPSLTGFGSLIAWGVFAAYCIVALVLFTRGSTPGKHLLHMRVIKEHGATAGFWTMLGREWIGKWISGMVFSLGYVWILIDRENQGWHDKLLATYVVEE
ncbi:MAG: RDD family protein [Gemmatimonadetes bacterium]|nr:RDD family protein [Gemmatimonadota bacterium]MYC00179.1 RDD family protein [Gemmatimonadota bacterium]MYI45188.1 RDD family protein [Gemmatimonadota bacterium]